MELDFTDITDADFEENTSHARRQEDAYYAEEGKKKCRCCGVVKGLDKFYKDNKNSDGKAHQCKVCKRKKAKSATVGKPFPPSMFKQINRIEIDGREYDLREARQLIKELRAWIKHHAS